MFRPTIIALREVHMERVEKDSMKTEAQKQGFIRKLKEEGKSCSQASDGLVTWLYSHASYVQCSLLKL